MQYVADDGTLEALCREWSRAGTIALDTEFERSVTYHPRPALIQVADATGIRLLDPLALADLEPLRALLAAGRPGLVMHSALEDLTVLERATGAAPSAVFDTQLAAAFAGLGHGLGYHALVRTALGVDLRKDQTRSDWLRRPLSEAQLRYAAEDVAHLPALHELLRARLLELSRLGWLEEETRRVFARAREDEVERDYLRLAARVDSDAARGALHALVRWRETQARERDRPRRHVVDDALLVAIARRPPRDRAALEALPEWRSHRGRARAAALLDAAAGAAGAAPRPLPPEAASLDEHRQTLAELKAIVARAAAALSIEASLLAPRRLLEKAVIHVRIEGRDGLPEELDGWRAPHLRDAMLECLHR